MRRDRLALMLSLLLAGCDGASAPAEEARQEDQTRPAPAASEEPVGRYAPRDECSDIQGAAEFRERLGNIVRRRDVDALVAVANEDIALDFAGSTGTDELRQRLADENSNLWRKLAEILAMGCASDGRGGMILPWIAAQDFGRIDPSVTWLVAGEDVSVKAEPDAGAEEIASVSWALLQIRSFAPNEPFQRVVIPGRDDAFIATDELRSLFDYRMLAVRKNGRWQITALVAGN